MRAKILVINRGKGRVKGRCAVLFIRPRFSFSLFNSLCGTLVSTLNETFLAKAAFFPMQSK